MIYVARQLSTIFRGALKNFPIVLITGPRQSGKTTFLRNELPRSAYVSFDDPMTRDFCRTDPRGFLAQFRQYPAILDEIQHAPELLPYLKMSVDQDRSSGRWVLTGSQQFKLMAGVSESLAGRVAILDLLPFSSDELKLGETELADICWHGFYPEPCLFPEKRDLWLNSYIQTYLERDVRQLESIRNLSGFERFLTLMAARHGQEFKAARLASECGVSQPTIANWKKLLEASYVLYTLPAYFRNFGKRLIKSPKTYFLDPALAAYLTRQPSAAAMLHGSMAGAIFEGLVVAEVVKFFCNRGSRPPLFFWRSQGGVEIDLLCEKADQLLPIEIKLTATPNLHQVRHLNTFKASTAGMATDQGLLVCTVDRPVVLPGNNLAIPWQEISIWLDEAKVITNTGGRSQS